MKGGSEGSEQSLLIIVDEIENDEEKVEDDTEGSKTNGLPERGGTNRRSYGLEEMIERGLAIGFRSWHALC
jgi:hypothetical protein